MIYRLLIVLIAVLLVTYYTLIVLHLLGVVKLTRKPVDAKKLLIPFYYFINNSKQKKL